MRIQCFALLLALFAVSPSQVRAADETLMRFPTLHNETIVFEAHGNIWEVSRTGGVASRLTADAGYDVMPRFSPNGEWIAFTGSYQGNEDVYVIPAGGGVARRLTFHSDVVPQAPTRWGPDNMVVTWTPDSKNIIFLSRRAAWNTWISRLFEVPLSGGLPTALPLDTGGLMTYSPDGRSIAYNRIFRNFRTWKRYTGGLAQQIYTYNFAEKRLKKITVWKGTNTAPMWYGRKIYFLSDRDANRRENVWVYDLDTHENREITHFIDYDVDFPSLGNNGIVFQDGGSLYVIDLPSEDLHELRVSVPDDGTRTQARYVDASKYILDTDTAGDTDYALSPNGKRAVFTARGRLFTVPAEHGATRDLAGDSRADEDHPRWSPDGRTIAYTTDSSGEQEIAIRPAEGGAQRIVTHFASGFFYQPVWSHDGKRVAVSDANHRLWLVDLTTGKTTQVAHDLYAEIHDEDFSPDGRWLAYSLTGANQQNNIWIYNVETGKAANVSEPLANDFNPVFSPNGKYLYFLSQRHENSALSETEFNIATIKTYGIYVATLRKTEPSPFAPLSDEGALLPPQGHHAGAAPATTPVTIDFDGLMERAVAVPVPAADYETLDARGTKLFYQTVPPGTYDGPLPGEEPVLHVYDLSERSGAVVVSGLDSYSLSADGTTVLYKEGAVYRIAPAAAYATKDARALDLSYMRARIEPTQEWTEMFDNAWRLERDLFVNGSMNGVNWQKIHDLYAKLLPLLGSREDLDYLIGEMQGELENSHTYVGGGDYDDPTAAVPTALLGVDFALDPASGRYRFERIYAGDNTRPAYRSPLSQPGVDVGQGDYLLAVDGRELKAPTNPYSLFVGLVNQPIVLTVAGTPNGVQRETTVEPISNEESVREQAWIDHNRELVDKLSGGKIAYIYLSDMETLGMDQFVRQFYPQLDKQALIVDDRWNGGGNIDQILLERLRRILIGMSTNREDAANTIPQQLIYGPKVCLINHWSASDGDIFPYFFRKYGLGPLIGTRTWGGVRGIRGDWNLLDGGYITIPEGALYGLDSKWVIENRGVTPDIEVETDPGQWMAGHDSQIEAAVNYLMRELRTHPHRLPSPPPGIPAYPPQ